MSTPPRLLDLVRRVARTRFGQDGAGECYALWVKRPIFILRQMPSPRSHIRRRSREYELSDKTPRSRKRKRRQKALPRADEVDDAVAGDARCGRKLLAEREAVSVSYFLHSSYVSDLALHKRMVRRDRGCSQDLCPCDLHISLNPVILIDPVFVNLEPVRGVRETG